MFTPDINKNFTWWIVASFLTVMGVIWLIEEQIGIATGWNLLLINSIASFGVVFSLFLVSAWNSWKFNRFLGLARGKSIALVISACKDTREWSREKPQAERERYYKMKNGTQKMLIEGSHNYIVGLETALLVSQFVYRLRDITNFELSFYADDATIDNSGPIFCFGSSRSNLRTEQLLSNETLEFIDADKLFLRIFNNPNLFTSNDSVDFGVLARVRYAKDWAFVFAGIDEEGTVAASYYFLEQWNSFTRYKAKPFIHIVECQKVDPKKPRKIAGYFCSESGNWEADRN